MVIETNSFGASRIVLEEYGLQDQVEAINRAAVDNARKAIHGKADTYIAGSIGPGTKLPSLGHISVDALAAAYVITSYSIHYTKLYELSPGIGRSSRPRRR